MNRFWILDYDLRDHEHDLLRSIANDGITCIVDEDAGGIVAYVLGDDGYVDALCNALNKGDE